MSTAKKIAKSKILKHLNEVCRVKRVKHKVEHVSNRGCTVPFLIKHLQDQFTPEMKWENYGTVWNVDHIKPICSFDFSKKKSFEQVNHYTNLRPLLIVENRRKGHKDVLLKHYPLKDKLRFWYRKSFQSIKTTFVNWSIRLHYIIFGY